MQHHRLMQVADCGNGAVLVLAASGDGSVSRLRMQVPTQPGSQPTAIQVGPLAAVSLCAWRCHTAGACVHATDLQLPCPCFAAEGGGL